MADDLVAWAPCGDVYFVLSSVCFCFLAPPRWNKHNLYVSSDIVQSALLGLAGRLAQDLGTSVPTNQVGLYTGVLFVPPRWPCPGGAQAAKPMIPSSVAVVGFRPDGSRPGGTTNFATQCPDRFGSRSLSEAVALGTVVDMVPSR